MSVFERMSNLYDLKKKIVPGMVIESKVANNIMQGRGISIADYANPANETYTIEIIFENSEEFKNVIVWKCHANAKTKISERSVFDRFVKDRIITTF